MKEKNEKEDIEKDIRKYSSIDAVKKSAGGKLIISNIQKDIISSVNDLSKFKTLSHIELISICAKLSEKLALLRVFNNAEKNVKFAEEELKFLLED